ncbi:MAG: GNAT family N-acetyltransferase [Acholeplasma sp.]|nr:GNAT family N-acetyltransferase [Acholeplasma sp.]
MKIEELSRQEYQNYPIDYRYQTKYYYHVKIKDKKHIALSIERKKYFFKQDKAFKGQLFESHLIVSDVFGILEQKKLVAVVEGTLETWNNRYRISNLWVDVKHRRKKQGTALLSHIEMIAKKKGARAVVLNLHSCNYPAIQFLKNQKYGFIGFDSAYYSNKDIAKKEIKFDFGKPLI